MISKLRREIKAFSAQEIQNLDKLAIEQHNIPSLTLMENAGRCVAEAVSKRLKKLRRKEVSIFCGTGNNGGDGFVTARHLLDQGIRTNIFLIGEPSKLKKDALENFQMLNNVVTVDSVSSYLQNA